MSEISGAAGPWIGGAGHGHSVGSTQLRGNRRSRVAGALDNAHSTSRRSAQLQRGSRKATAMPLPRIGPRAGCDGGCSRLLPVVSSSSIAKAKLTTLRN